jgi:predicted metalloprotease
MIKTNSKRMRRVIAGMALAVLATGCGVTSSATLSTTHEANDKPRHTTTSTTEPEKIDPDLQEVLDDTSDVVTLLDDYYGQNIEGYQSPDQLIFYVTGEGVVHDDGTVGPEMPTCGGKDVGEQQNAFYCPSDNTVIASLDLLLDEQKSIGDSFTFVVFAHEYGHSAQAAVGFEPSTDYDTTELQADCYAGAFIQYEADSGQLVIEDGDEAELNQSIAAVADDYGSSEGGAGEHGTLAQRATAFEHGRAEGAAACQADYA